jgi:hypothetical protein
VNVLDENILESQRQLLRAWRIPVRQIGVELGRKGMSNEEILPFLLTLSNPTFFTRDLGFASHDFCHERRCIVVLAVGQYESAHFVRRVLHQRDFDTQSKRMGAVLRVGPTGILVLRRNVQAEVIVRWRS